MEAWVKNHFDISAVRRNMRRNTLLRHRCPYTVVYLCIICGCFADFFYQKGWSSRWAFCPFSPTLGTAEILPLTIFVGWARWTFRILLFCCAAVASLPSHQITWKCAELAKQGSKVSLQKTARESQYNESPRLDGILM